MSSTSRLPTILPPDTPKEYGVAFELKKGSPYLRFVRVRLDLECMTAEESINVSLRDHPLYPFLARYVQANPL